MGCVITDIEGALYCDNKEAETGGLKDTISIFQHQDVLTYPVYSTTIATNGTTTASEALITANAAIIMKPLKKPLKFQVILEKNSLSVSSEGVIFNTELKVRMQDNTHNRGLSSAIIKNKFTAEFREDNGQSRLIGQSDNTSTGYLAMVKTGSYKEEIQEGLNGERYIEFIIMAKRYQPVNYNFPITY